MLQGLYTAIVTPFNEDGSIDEHSFRELIEEQVSAGVTGIVPCGTTGESPSLDYKEHDEVIRIVVDQVRKRCEVMAGTGSNSTKEAIEMTKHAKSLGVTSSLQVVPYYNKPTQKGQYEHFKAVAESSDLPIVIYNIQGRTGVNMETSTLMELSKIKNIIAVKEASGSVSQMIDILELKPKGFSVLSGDDKLTLPLMACGGSGVISVASNVIPKKMVEFVNFGLNNDFISMRKIQLELNELFTKLFVETNPIPVKKILALKGKIKSSYRLPICEPSDKTVETCKYLIEKYKI